MKTRTRRIWWWCWLGWWCGQTLASEWIVETSTAYVATGRFRAGSDGTDVAVVDRASGLARVGHWDSAVDGYRWEDQAVGMSGITGFAVLRGGTMDRWMATGAEWNAVQFVTPGSPPETRVSPVAAPRRLAWDSRGRETGVEVEGAVVFSDFGATGSEGRMGTLDEAGRLEFTAAERGYGRVLGLTLGPPPAVPVVVAQRAGGLSLGRTAAGGWAADRLDLAVVGGDFLWAAAETSVYVAVVGEDRLVQHELAGKPLGGGYQVAAGVAGTVVHEVDGAVVGLDTIPWRDPRRPGIRHGLVLRYADAPDQPRLYRVEGTPPELTEVAAIALPAGEVFVGVVGLGSDFLVLSGGGGSVMSWQRFGAAGADGVPVRVAEGQVPGRVETAARPNLFLFDRDPLLEDDAVLMGSERRLDWTAVEGGLVVGASDGGAVAGLGTLGRLGPIDPGRVGLGNQMLREASVAGFGPIGGRLRPEVTFEPPPGAHATPPAGRGMRVEIRSAASAGGGIWYRRSGDDGWQKYDPSVGVVLVGDDVITAYQEGVEEGGRTKLAVGAYRFGSLPSVEPVSGADADGDGLSDGWEFAFGVDDPGSDTDGDGATARQEFVAGTDPLDPSSRPAGGGAPPPVLEVGRDGEGRLRLAWAGAAGEVVLEASEDLLTWQPVSPQPVGNGWAVGTEGAGRFFRLRRL